VNAEIDGKPVRMRFEVNLIGTARMKWRADGESGVISLGRLSGSPVWLEPKVSILGAERKFLIYANISQGFVVGIPDKTQSFAVRDSRLIF
jgi:hypothetical protein